MYDVPILFLVFNRPETTRHVFQSIRKVQPSVLYIAADGPRDGFDGENELVEEVKNYILGNIDWECDVKTLFRDSNLGCKKAVSSAIDWFFDNVEMGVILEDDCVPSTDFFKFCKEMLFEYKSDDRVMHIGGTNFIDNLIEVESSYYFSKNTHVWGWATWKRAWSKYDVYLSDLDSFIGNNVISSVFTGYQSILARSFLSTLAQIRDGNIDTWDYQWVYAVLKNNALSIIPSNNLVKNIGFGADATHTKDPTDSCSNMRVGDFSKANPPDFVLQNKMLDDIYCKAEVKKAAVSKIKSIYHGLLP